MFFKIITERRSILKSAGKSDFCNRVISRAEHLDSHPQTVPEKILFGRCIFMFHEYFVQISAVYAYMSGYIRDPDIIAVVVFHVFFG